MVDAVIRMTKICIVNTTKYNKYYAINIKQHYKLILILTEKLLKSTNYIVIVW